MFWMLWFFISSCYFCILIIWLFLADSSLSRLASFICLYCFIIFCWRMACLVFSFIMSFYARRLSSSSCRWRRRSSFLLRSSSLRWRIFITCSAFRLVSSIFFQAFFSSSLSRAIRLARSFASSAAFFLLRRVATNAPVTSSSPSGPYWPSYCPSSPYSCCSSW